MDEEFTVQDVAGFMKDQLDEKKHLYQEDIAYQIQTDFGDAFVYENDNGGLSIDRKVLKAFRELTPNVVWERGEKCWRYRADWDDPDSRLQE